MYQPQDFFWRSHGTREGHSMALLAESLVEEWLNRDGFFTIRGVKHGVGEMDLLAVKPQPDGMVIGWHVEVQVSFRPVAYIAKLTDEVMKGFARSRTSAKARSPEQIDVCARAWVNDKFRAKRKGEIRERLWPAVKWSFHFVHGVVRERSELKVFAEEGVICHSFHDLLSALAKSNGESFSGSAGGDLAEIVSYYKSHQSGTPDCTSVINSVRIE
jgi:hypothetical protein